MKAPVIANLLKEECWPAIPVVDVDRMPACKASYVVYVSIYRFNLVL